MAASDEHPLEDFFLSDDPDAVLRAERAIASQSAGEVTVAETIIPITGNPVPRGIFCGRIFGPVADDSCICGRLRGPKHRGDRCERCGVLCAEASLRDRSWGHIELATPLVHPALRGRVAENARLTERDLDRVLRGSHVLTPEGVLVQRKEDEVESVTLAEHLGSASDLLCNQVPVSPPGSRPDGARENDAYLRVVARANRLRRLLELGAPAIIIRNDARKLQLLFERLIATERVEREARRAPKPQRSALTDELLAAVLAAPDAPGPRAVYADHLLEIGDPRGEFIVLQNANAEKSRMSARESVLLRRHRGAWLGDLDDVVEMVKFRRGFMVRCRTNKKRREAVLERLGHPNWATVEHLTTDVVELITHPSMRSLHSIGVSFATLRELCLGRNDLSFIDTATVQLSGAPPRGHHDVTASKALSALRDLTVVHKRLTEKSEWGWLIESELVRGLGALTIARHLEAIGETAIAPWLALLSRAPELVLRLTFGQRQIVFDLEHDGHPRAKLHIAPSGAERLACDGIARDQGLPTFGDAITAALREGNIQSLEVTGRWWPLSKDFQRFAKALRRTVPRVTLPT